MPASLPADQAGILGSGQLFAVVGAEPVLGLFLAVKILLVFKHC